MGIGSGSAATGVSLPFERVAVAKRLRERVLAAEASEKLSEVALAREFGVKRSSLRSATSDLVAEGLLGQKSGEGFYPY